MFRGFCRVFTVISLLVLSGVSAAQGDAAGKAGASHANLQGEPVDLGLWHPRFQERCYFFGAENNDTAAVRTIQELLNTLRREPVLGDYLLEKARRKGTAFCLDDRADGARGYFDYGYNVISVRESLPMAQKLVIYVHELRHLDNVLRGYCMSLDYDASEMVRLTYAVEADVQAFAALYAWRMKQRGDDEPWQALLRLPHYADIAWTFAEKAQTTGDEKQGMMAAFSQWYRSQWRLENYHNTCYMGYLDLQDETKRSPRYDLLPAHFFDSLCVLPDGTNYGCHLAPEIGRHP